MFDHEWLSACRSYSVVIPQEGQLAAGMPPGQVRQQGEGSVQHRWHVSSAWFGQWAAARLLFEHLPTDLADVPLLVFIRCYAQAASNPEQAPPSTAGEGGLSLPLVCTISLTSKAAPYHKVLI